MDWVVLNFVIIKFNCVLKSKLFSALQYLKSYLRLTIAVCTKRAVYNRHDILTHLNVMTNDSFFFYT